MIRPIVPVVAAGLLMGCAVTVKDVRQGEVSLRYDRAYGQALPLANCVARAAENTDRGTLADFSYRVAQDGSHARLISSVAFGGNVAWEALFHQSTTDRVDIEVRDDFSWPLASLARSRTIEHLPVLIAD